MHDEKVSVGSGNVNSMVALLRQAMEEHGLTIGEIARITGKSKSLVSRLVNNRYNGGSGRALEEVIARLQEAGKWVSEQPIEDDKPAAEPEPAKEIRWRVDPSVVVRTTNLQSYHDLVIELRSPESRLGPSLGAVMGLTGRGKTTASQHLAASLEHVRYIRALSFWSTADLLREICFAFTGERPGFRNKALEKIRTVCEVNRHVLIIDEADGLTMRTHLNPLRGIAEVCNLSVIFVGEEQLVDVLKRERRLWRRVRRVVEFEDLNAGDLAVFWNTAVGYAPPEEVMDALYKRCDGDFRVAVGDAVNLCRLARNLQVKGITLDMLKGLQQ